MTSPEACDRTSKGETTETRLMDRIVEGFLVAANAGIQSAESPC